jgi:CBS domain containing-hemolysin-like protein
MESMSEDALLLLAYIILALLLSFLCSIAEAVLLSITPSYTEAMREQHPERARHLIRVKQQNLDRSLAAILTLNTIAHTVGAIGAGAKATDVFGSAWFGLFSAVMTLLILFLSEIVPKTIGALYWDRLVWPTVHFVRSLAVLLYPLVWLSERVTRIISRGREVQSFNRDEFLAMTRVGEKSGQVNRSESRIIQNILRFGELKVADIMTPRTVVSALPESAGLGEAARHFASVQFSRVPLYGGDIDEITGFVLREDVARAAAAGGDSLRALRREIYAVPENMPLSNLLDQLLKNRRYIAVVVNEYGGTAGLVTLEDLIETLVGIEIVDEVDEIEDMRLHARRLWQERVKALGVAGEEPAPTPPGTGS